MFEVEGVPKERKRALTMKKGKLTKQLSMLVEEEHEHEDQNSPESHAKDDIQKSSTS